MKYIAHIRSSNGEYQGVEEHLLNVKSLAEGYGEKVGVKHLAGLAGLLHDVGKYSNAFRDYILEADYSKRGTVDHSTAGGKWLFEQFHNVDRNTMYELLVAEVVGNVIISHHSYLQDFIVPKKNESSYLKRVFEKDIVDYDNIKKLFFDNVMSENEFILYVSNAVEEIRIYLERVTDEDMNFETKLMFLSKLIFSMLIDADRTDSRLFEEGSQGETPINTNELFKQYHDKLIHVLEKYSKKGHINQLRDSMSKQCEEFAENPSGIYTLSIPTGGGKTLASLRYALRHCLLYKKKSRIIYVVPYTTIIEQNAMDVREKLDDYEHILEHHSNIIEDYSNMENGSESEEDQIDDTIKKKLKLARDNWDSPIIFTTMVQFLNVFYAKGTRDIRRLHRLLNSVIVFDEVQKVPLHCSALFNLSVNFLKLYGNSSILLCTATQPTLSQIEKYQLSIDKEIIEGIDNVVDAFKRVEVVDKLVEITDNDDICLFIQEILPQKKNLLVILNTKRAVKDLYKKLVQLSLVTPIYHLSTSMCAAHRKNILLKVKKHLELDESVICISTQLIEAGVDISFNCVIRSLAGLDSIAQAAGRCNRHGENKIQQVYVVNNKTENLDNLKEISTGREVAKGMFRDLRDNPKEYGGNILSRKAMEIFFKKYYNKMPVNCLNYPTKELDNKAMVEVLTDNTFYHNAYVGAMNQLLPLYLKSSYYSAAKYFKAIDNETITVVVPYKDKYKVHRDGKDLIADLSGDNSIESFSQWLKEAQMYTIEIYSYTKKELENNIIEYKDKNIFILTEASYNEEIGLDIESESLSPMII
jgi:CRISPR-associated endonuclease/helicase Cas3